MPFTIIPNYRLNGTSRPSDAIVKSATTTNHGMFVADYGTVYYSADGNTWTIHSTFNSNTSNHYFQNFYIDYSGRVYAYGEGLNSSDRRTTTPISYWNGSAWQTLPALSEAVIISAVCAFYVSDPAGRNVVITAKNVATNNIDSTTYSYVLNSGLTTWARSTSTLNSLLSNSWAGFGDLLAYSPQPYYNTTNGQVFSGKTIYYNAIGGVLKSTDGLSWTLSSTIGGRYTGIIQAGIHIVASIGSGIKYSSDNGTTWTQVDFGSSDIRGIAYSPNTGGLIAVGYGGYNPDALAGQSIWCSNISSLGTWTASASSSVVPYDLWSCTWASGNFVVRSIGGTTWYCAESNISTNQWTKVIAGPAGSGKVEPPYAYANRLGGYSYIDEITYMYGNAAIDYYQYSSYPTDVPYYSKWDKVTLDLATLVGSGDDGYYSSPISMGFDWGYNGATYNTFVLNTNGQIQFDNFKNNIYPDSTTVGIVAHHGDLRFHVDGSYKIRSTASYGIGEVSSPTNIELASLNNYGLTATQTPSYLSLNGSGITHVKKIVIIGYTTTSNVYNAVPVTVYLIPGIETRIYEIPGTNIASIYFSSIKSQVLPADLRNADHAIWKKNISWVDNGITHNILRIYVQCTSYTSVINDRPASYVINLYKCGAIQHIHVALSPYAVTPNGPTGTVSATGPAPFIVTGNISAPNSYIGTSWVSYDNGASWSSPKLNSVVNSMGPSLVTGTGNNTSIEYLKRYFRNTRTGFYGPTSTVPSLSASDYGVGTYVGQLMLNYIVGLTTTSDAEEQEVYNLFSNSYGVQTGGSKKGGSYLHVLSLWRYRQKSWCYWCWSYRITKYNGLQSINEHNTKSCKRSIWLLQFKKCII